MPTSRRKNKNGGPNWSAAVGRADLGAPHFYSTSNAANPALRFSAWSSVTNTAS